MAAGKTTVGRVLAARLDWQFVDLDRELERRAGYDIPTLFARDGEQDFRRRELEVIEATAFWTRVVFATGGGAFVGQKNIERIRRAGVTVWIAPSLERVFERLEKSPKVRPLFQDRERARALYEERKPWYEQAHLHVPVSEQDDSESVADRVIGLLRENPCVT